MGRHGAPSASLGSGSARVPPEAGQVRATRRSDAIPRPRAGCPATSAAGLIMTVKHDARGQHELRCRAFCPRSACQPGCSAWHRQLARRRSQARLLGVVGCLRHTRRPPDECMVALSEMSRALSAHHGACSCPSSAQTPVHPAWALSSGAGPSAWTLGRRLRPTCEHDRRGH